MAQFYLDFLSVPDPQFPALDFFRHRLSVVDGNCKIGKGSKLWQFASVIRGAIIGADCNIGSCSVVDSAVLGSGCSIGHGAQIHPGTQLCERVFVGPGAIICNDMWPSVDKEGWEPEGRVTVRVGDDSSIGAGAIILPGVNIGPNAFVSAGAIVDKDVPSGMMFRRDGNITRIPPDWKQRRTRVVE